MIERTKRAGCFRVGCLTVLGAAVVAVVLLVLLFPAGGRLPDRFVLLLHVGGQLDERSPESVTLPFATSRSPLSLQDIVSILDHARKDDRVRSVLLDIEGLSASPAKIGQLRRSVEEVRKAGKQVAAFLSTPEDKDYLLAVACDSVVVQKGSYLLLDGLKSELFFYTGSLRKVGVGFQAAQWKEYKSGIEPYTRTSASREAREQVARLLDDAFGDYAEYVTRRRGISRQAFSEVIDSLAVITPVKALSLKLVDRISGRWQLEREFEKRLGAKRGKVFVSGRDYLRSGSRFFDRNSKDAVAVITVAGPIVRTAGYSATGYDRGMDEQTLKHAVEAALEDRSVKAIVLRIDSPGGDALAAEAMLGMLDAARAKKPLVASMSGVAASGGYMVALAANRILAEPLTVTGSIGVFALKPDLSALLEKTGLRREVVARGRFADAYTVYRPFDEESFGKFVDASGEIYRRFTAEVASRRHLTPAQVDSVAGGRVWTGRRALSLKLVDQFGGLQEAVKTARQLAGMDTTKAPLIRFLPEEKSWIDYLMAGEFGAAVRQEGYRIAADVLAERLPAAGVQDDLSAIRMLMDLREPQILALEPLGIVIR
jgi:protease-4